jgi:hypothetical protein
MIRREQERKRMEKDGAKILDELIWGLPAGREYRQRIIFARIVDIAVVEAPALADFWKSTFKVQVEARTGEICIDNGKSKLQPQIPKTTHQFRACQRVNLPGNEESQGKKKLVAQIHL